MLSVRGHNYTLTSAALKPFCLCVVAPAPWTMGFTHWGPPLFLFSVFSIPAVADAVVAPIWADFPSSRRPSRDIWNCAINAEEQFITAALASLYFTTFLWKHKSWKVQYGFTVKATYLLLSPLCSHFPLFGLSPIAHCSVKHWLRKLGRLVNECSISVTFG